MGNMSGVIGLMLMLVMMKGWVNAENSVSFKFEEFYGDTENLILQGSATTNKNVLQLTDNDSLKVGRALFSAPIKLWESPSIVASFETNFTFSIKSTFDSFKADGLAFFLASPDTQIPPNSAGKYLGLFSDPDALQNSSTTTLTGLKDNRVVAVEFDTYPDVGDPSYTHIGVDVNSIISKKTTQWDPQNGIIGTAHITYNSTTKILTVVVSYPKTAPVTLSYYIALNTVLPKWVRVGFSASTGLILAQFNTIHSWSFSSRLDTVKPKPKPMPNQDIYIATVV